ncbi:virulence factor [Bacillaceae bacterium ZC4]|uniref:Virulence factor n=1 Tax=Aeribacillus pallidus TaxID=33936 RepID=A0A161WWQ9_9BACI|nr:MULTISPECIES: conserved virulence factor C family protein [Aeribacillus]AXI39605.1 virulence factor [Bacillaceae bacterium ZC4]REJ25077.1 MAG: virulence factor [Bacillaceae bacterium]ASS90983.1 virulence factor [Aeribacillus pallidus]KZM54409.1 virulence factor [Aeribacillus pallidus]MDR9793566.1 conserved virulence factor C family protein [Aeribacillus pallidus]
MNIKSIEPTPSPNTMKVILDQELPAGKRNNYKKENAHEAPKEIQSILAIEGVKGVYHVADFMAIERNSKYHWQDILSEVRSIFGEQVEDNSQDAYSPEEGYGEVKVFIQMFHGLPMQVKLTDGHEERRYGLPERFRNMIMEVQKHANNVVLEREWKEHGVRYGDLDAIGQEVVDEISAAYPDDRLERIKNRIIHQKDEKETFKRFSYKVTVDMLDDPDWQKRFAHLEQMDPTLEDLDVLEKALNDEKASIRRLATVYLGMLEDPAVLPLLYKALKDKSVTVRRTAGDALSDIGDKAAIPEMAKALKDKSKLVRWRAAMFLYEVGDESVLKELKEAEDDPEFEVKMQIKMAIERIEKGEEAKGSVWKQMTESRQK